MLPEDRRKINESILEVIGRTPLVRLQHLPEDAVGQVLMKCEYLNPSGSVKDRMTINMIETAEKEGKIDPSRTQIVEASSGNTAISLSMVCAAKGYKIKIYFPEATMVPEKIAYLKRFGAELEETPLDYDQADDMAKQAGLHGAAIEVPGRVKALEDEKRDPSVYWTRQFGNPANSQGQESIAYEILEQTNGKVDAFVASIGTGGTVLGAGSVLKKEVPGVKIIAVQPTGWEGWTDPLSPETKYIPGITDGLNKEIRDSGLADEVVWVGNDEARDTAYLLSQKEGIMCGMSAGANVWVAMQEARKPEMKDKNIVAVLVDRGDRYFSDERYIT
jgi:cysteine synthase A